MKAVAALLVIVAITTAENLSEADKINNAYVKMQANDNLIKKFLPAGEETTLVQEPFALTNKPSVPAWVSTENDLEAFLQEEAMSGRTVTRRVTGVAQAGSAPEAVMVQEDSDMQTPLEAAKDKVANMLQEDTQAKRSACVKAADASINGVFRDVKNAQRMLNRIDNGRSCATRNQHLINRAKRTISHRTRQVHASVVYQRKMRRSRVHWNFSFESLREGSCSAFYRSGQWQTAKRRVHHANRRLTGARANLRAARNNLQVQIRNAKRVRNQCRCRVLARTARALKTAKRLTGDRMKTLLREMMVKCLVAARRHGKNANKVAARCKNLRVSAGYKRRLRLFRTRLAPGVSAARCNGNFGGNGGKLLKSGAFTLRRNYRLTSSFTTTSEYDLTFRIKPLRKLGGWRSILHFTKNNRNYGRSEDRNPAIWFHSNSFRLHIRQGRKGHINDGCDPSQQLAKGRWTNVRIKLRKTRMQVFYNGRNVCNGPAYKDAISRQTGMKVYAADPWYGAASAQLANIRYTPFKARKAPRRGGRAPRAGFSQRMHKTSRNKPACKAMRAFRNRLSNSKTYSKIVVKSAGKGGYTCSNPGIATKICRAIKSANKRVTLKVKCAGVMWAVGQCGAANGKKGMELNVAVRNNGNICQCQNKGFTLRPCIGHSNSNWGGFGNSCGGRVSQTMQVSCQ